MFRQDYNEEILRSEHQYRDESITGVMDSLIADHVGRADDIMTQRLCAVEYVATEGGSWSKALGTDLVDGATSLSHPGLRGDMNRQTRRDQRWIGKLSN